MDRFFSLDYQTLLLAVGVLALCLGLSMLSSWASTYRERFMLSWVVGALLVAIYVFLYGRYVVQPSRVVGSIAFMFLMTGLGGLLLSAMQFAGHRSADRHVTRLVALTIVVTVLPMALGLDGLALFALNLATAFMLAAAGLVYWRVRAEAPVPIAAMSILYAVSALSFVLCAIMIALEGSLVLGRAPDNWAETLNVFVCMIGVASIGALSLALNHARNSQLHSRDARTDPLTGLMNRRALFDIYEGRKIGPFIVVAAFDLDHFKSVNDTHGHAVGDQVLERFARIMLATKRQNDLAVRLGGEEFALVMSRTTMDQGEEVAESIRLQLAATTIETDEGELCCTVSVGLASGDKFGSTFAQVLRAADAALYQAKSTGRDRIVRSNLRLVPATPGLVAHSNRN